MLPCIYHRSTSSIISFVSIPYNLQVFSIPKPHHHTPSYTLQTTPLYKIIHRTSYASFADLLKLFLILPKNLRQAELVQFFASVIRLLGVLAQVALLLGRPLGLAPHLLFLVGESALGNRLQHL